MRPGKYGYFWYLVTYCPEPRIAEVIGNTVKTMDGMILDIDIFERDSDFKCWLGQAHPPKLNGDKQFTDDSDLCQRCGGWPYTCEECE